MKYLITGITGFAGPHLANLLYEENHKVYGLIRRSNGMETDIKDVVYDKSYENITFLYADLTDRFSVLDLLKNNQFDGIFHLAAQSNPPTSFTDPIGTFNVNIMGTAYIIEGIMKYQPECRIMFCSTSEVYGNLGKDQRMLKETDKLEPSNPYGVSKASIDLYMQERMNNGFTDGFITRAFSHTGPRRGKNFSISSDAYQIARMIKGYQSKILLIGNLETVRVVMDVRDTVKAYYLLMINKNSKGNIYNVCGNIPRKMGYFTDKLIEISGLKGIEKTIDPNLFRKIDIQYQHGDSTKLSELTGWEPKYNIETTLSDLLEYWKNKITN